LTWRQVPGLGLVGLAVPALLASPFARDTTVLMLGTTAAQVMNLGASPILARLYSPEHLGTLGLVLSLYSVLTPLACWRLEQAIMLPSTDHEAGSLVRLALLLTAASTGLSVVVVTVFGERFALAIGHAEAGLLLWTIPALVLLAGVYQTLRAWLGRTRQFGSLASGRVTRAGVMNGAQIGAGWLLGASSAALVGGYFLGATLEALVLMGSALRTSRARLQLRTSPSLLRSLVQRHRKFPLFAVPGSLSNLFALEAPTLLLATLFSPTDVGLYWMSYRVLALPTALVGEAASTVFYQRMAAMRARGESGAALTTQVFVLLLGAGFIPMAVLFAIGPAVAEWAFGPGWAPAGDYARALVPGLLMLFAVLPLTQCFFIYEKQEYGLIWNLGFLTISVGAFAVGAAVAGPLAAVQLYSVASAVMYGLVALMAFRWSGARAVEIPGYLSRGLRDWQGAHSA
jgi:O-antigen/teichoic acid export membrane protein